KLTETTFPIVVLRGPFEPKSRARLAGVVDEFYNIKFNPDEETVGIYCRKVSEKASLIKDGGFDIPDTLKCFQLIRKLPADYENLVQILIESHRKPIIGPYQRKPPLDVERIKYPFMSFSQAHPKLTETTFPIVVLRGPFEPKSRARLAGVVDEFYNIKFNPDEETVGIYCRKVSEKASLIKDGGFDIPDTLKCFQLIRKLPADYENLVQILYRVYDKEFTFANIQKQLITEEGRTKQKRKDDVLSNNVIEKCDEWIVDSGATSHFCTEKVHLQNFVELPPTEVLIGDKNAKSHCAVCSKYEEKPKKWSMYGQSRIRHQMEE
ncbi:hypothetical protein TSAR_013965, partial [Trichomalopsis sarcophagae]